MGGKDPRVDAYIANAQPFARPILKHLRRVVHEACPEVEETLKWRMPAFMYKGILCGMAAFKEHCVFGFWKGDLIGVKPKGGGSVDDAMWQLGRITTLQDLPSEAALTRMVKKARALNDEGVKRPVRRKAPASRALEVPAWFTAALRRNKRALAAFDGFSYSHRKEYVEWVTEAKTDATRKRRMATTIEWLSQGKSRNWKYEPPKPRPARTGRTGTRVSSRG